MVRALLLTLFLGACVVGCTSGSGESNAPTTPPAAADSTAVSSPAATATPVPSVSASSTPGAAPTLTEADLPRPEWTKLPGPPLGEYELLGLPFILDVESGDFYSIVANPEVLSPMNQGWETRNLSVVGWSGALGFVVTASLYRPYSGEMLQAIYAAKPGEPFRRIQPLNRGPWTEIFDVEAGGAARTEVLDKTQTVRTAILDPLTFDVRQTILDRGTPDFSPDGRYLIVASEQKPQFDIYGANGRRPIRTAGDCNRGGTTCVVERRQACRLQPQRSRWCHHRRRRV
jgi:hypothetical protein